MHESLTDRVYSLAELLEARRRRMRLILFMCFMISSIAVAFSVWSYLVLAHQKGPVGQQMLLPALGALLGAVLLAVGLRRYIRVRRCDRSLDELERLEETVYREVFRAR
ncbi:MAG: hypothetical protein QW781_00910 [Methanothrix sp.]|uniref:hypothetical protein n=1 Tax=Methanothrix sp. TaxID=90426 RepID=UPI00316A6EF9|nr:hypothetical protein [Methanothrix sp.]